MSDKPKRTGKTERTFGKPHSPMQNPSPHAGRTSGRFIKSLLLGRGNQHAASAFVDGQRWTDAPAIKAAIGANRLSDLPGNPVETDFMDALRPVSILSRLDGARRVPLETRVIAFGAGATGYLVAEGAALPLSADAFTGVTVPPRKFGALCVVSEELLAVAAPGTEAALARDLAAAVGAREDQAFLDPSLAGSALASASSAASTGTTLANVDADLATAVGLLNGSGSTLVGAVWLLSVAAATRLALLRGSGGAPAHPDITQTGGRLAGIPAIVSDAAAGRLVLLDQAQILLSQETAVELEYSNAATLEMTNTPVANSLTPTPATTMVSMFQTSSKAVRALLIRGWYARPGAAAYITGGLF